MIQFILQEFVIRWERLLKVEQDYALAAAKRGQDRLVPEDFHVLESINSDFRYICHELRLEDSQVLLSQFAHVIAHEPCLVQSIMGLRELARSLRAKIKKTPLDYAGWKSVVDAIDNKLTAKIPKARGPKQTSALKFKHDLLADFKAFEVLRNEVMHCRWHCNPKEAEGLFIRVRAFMQRLAANLK